ncbi:MAG: hypothetical protein H7231_02980, partial [Rhodoferax sp.]|nr:hypothetical protein [Actinomycetota bacterium]
MTGPATDSATDSATAPPALPAGAAAPPHAPRGGNALVLAGLGIVFGGIGTSPLDALRTRVTIGRGA